MSLQPGQNSFRRDSWDKRGEDGLTRLGSKAANVGMDLYPTDAIEDAASAQADVWCRS